MRILYSLIALLLFCSQPDIGFGAVKNLWISSNNAKLKAAPKSSADTVVKLPIGTKLMVEGKQKRWYKVNTEDGRSGWIYRGKVSKLKPEFRPASEDSAAQDNSLGNMLAGLTGSSIQADSADSARSIRGLSPDTEEYARQTGTPLEIRQALDRVLATPATQNEVERFLQSARIGEYAE